MSKKAADGVLQVSFNYSQRENVLLFSRHEKHLKVKYMYLTIILYLNCLPRLNANATIGMIVK